MKDGKSKAAVFRDPVESFRRASTQSGTAASKWDQERKLRARIDRQPLIALIWSSFYPGAGMFYIGRPLAGIVDIIIFFLGLVCIIFLDLTFLINTFLGTEFSEFPWYIILVKLVIFAIYALIFTVITGIITFRAAKSDREAAIMEWERLNAENDPPEGK